MAGLLFAPTPLFPETHEPLDIAGTGGNCPPRLGGTLWRALCPEGTSAGGVFGQALLPKKPRNFHFECFGGDSWFCVLVTAALSFYREKYGRMTVVSPQIGH